jgi:hypothetical protein
MDRIEDDCIARKVSCLNWAEGIGAWLCTYLDLIDNRRPDVADLLDLLNVSNSIVAHTDISDLARLLRLLQREPHQFSALLPSVGTVNQEKIHIPILAIQLLHALNDRVICRVDVLSRRQYLAREVDVRAQDLGIFERTTDGGLVVVILRGVDVAIACTEGFDARLHAGWRGRLVDTEADLWNLELGVRERESGGDAELGWHSGGAGWKV